MRELERYILCYTFSQKCNSHGKNVTKGAGVTVLQNSRKSVTKKCNTKLLLKMSKLCAKVTKKQCYTFFTEFRHQTVESRKSKGYECARRLVDFSFFMYVTDRYRPSATR